MASHVNQGNSVECQKSFVATRKVSGPFFVSLPTLTGSKIPLFKYKTNIRSLVFIIEQLNPFECIICKESKMNLNDVLEGTVIEVYTKKRIKFKLESNYSNVHGIQGDHVTDFTYAKIVIPWEYVLNQHLIPG